MRVKYVRKGFWKQRDGVLIRIREMEDDHLCNTLRLIKRFCEHKLDFTQRAYATAWAPTADMAEMLFEQEFDFWTEEATWEDCLPDADKFEELAEEADRRSLVWELPPPKPKRKRRKK
jgi:hypothetical protein